jgi:hypothetical protein
MDGILRKRDLPAVMATQDMGKFGPTLKTAMENSMTRELGLEANCDLENVVLLQMWTTSWEP